MPFFGEFACYVLERNSHCLLQGDAEAKKLFAGERIDSLK
jgi:hypothetical protein